MKYISTFFLLIFFVGCSENVNQPKGHSQVVTRIDTPELIEAFITYVHKVEKPKVDKSNEMRKELQAANAKDDPLFAPYIARGKRINRTQIIDQIEKAIEKWGKLDIPVPEMVYASDKSNLKRLTDAELVIALRLINQVVNQMKDNHSIHRTR